MPTSVAIAVASSFAAETIAAAVITDAMIASVSWITYAGIESVIGFTVSAGLRMAVGSGAETSPTTSPAFTAQATSRTHVIRSSVANRQIVYGRAMVSGPLIFAATDISNRDLHMVIAIAGHEIDAVESVYFNDDLSSDSKFSGYETITAHLGATDQVADANLVALGFGWTAAHRLRGVAYLYIKLTYSGDVYPRGIPNIKAVIRGKKLYDPRTTTTVWSQNLALAVRDYLAGSYGLASTSAEIDDTALIAAANICDEAVSLAAGGTEARYTCNGVMDTGSTPRAVMEALLSGCGGALTWPAGRWTLHVGAYESPTVTLDEDDLAGPIQVRARVPRQDLYNAIKGTYVDPAKYWQPGDFPPVTNSTYATQDGAQIFRDIALPVTTSSATAQRLARMMVEKSRQGITVQAAFKLSAFKLATWDNLMLTIAQMGWTSKVFKVTGWGFNEAGNINLTLQEEAAACYTWSAAETIVDPAPDTNLPAWDTIAAPGTPDVAETLFETTGSAGVKARATMSWAAVIDAFVRDYLPEYRPAGGAWVVLPASAALAIDINDIAPGQYEFRVRARNSMGVASAYSATRAKEILGLTAPPADITGLGIQAAGGLAILTFALHPDLDVRQGGAIRARHSPSLSGATWETSTGIGEAGAGTATVLVLPLKAGTYLLKAEDSGGRPSVTAASISTKQATALAWSTLSSVQEDDDFLGTHSSTYVDGVDLQLGSDTLFDAATGNFDDAAGLFDYFGGVAAAGTYDFAAGMDLGVVSRVRLTSLIAASAVNVSTSFDETAGLFDDAAGLFDGTEGAPVDAWVEARETDDDPAGTPTWSAWKRLDAAEFVARGFDFRARLTSGDQNYTIKITQLRVAAEQIA
jgi:hypothetical protein